VAWGAGIVMNTAMSAEILSTSGFDFVLIDLEHGAMDDETAHQMVAVLRGTRTLPVARVAGHEPWQLKRTLDTGVVGVVVPFVNSAEDAERVVSGCKYPPAGIRGLACQTAAMRWDCTIAEYVASANDEIMVIVQIETPQAAEAAAEIVAVPGIDMIFVGPADLSASCGYPLQPGHPAVEKRIADIARCASRAGVALGTVAKSEEDIARRLDQGFSFLVVTTDMGAMLSAASGAVAKAKAVAGRIVEATV
jgi:2-keto-3-deoxy-L-rhamnonate aldolase RhmA